MRRPTILITPFVFSGLLLGGCSAGSAAGDGALVLPPCPPSWSGAKEALLVLADTRSQRGKTITDTRLDRTRRFLQTAAACSTTATVDWSQGQTQVTSLYSGTVRKEAETEIATARLSNKRIDEDVMPKIAEGIAALTRTDAPVASSPSGAFDIARDVFADGQPGVLVVVDNFVAQGDGTDVDDAAFDTDAARTLAARASVPKLASVTVTMEGVGVTVDSTPAPDDWVRAVRAYADALCEKTGATCRPASTQLGAEG